MSSYPPPPRPPLTQFNQKAIYLSAGSRSSDKGGEGGVGGGGSHPDPEMRGGAVSKKKIFIPSGLSLV